MAIINVTEKNCKCYVLTFQNKGWIKVEKKG